MVNKNCTSDECITHLFACCIGWRKLFEHSQDVICEILKSCSADIPDDLYLKCLKIRELHELPKKYTKGV